MIEIEKYPCIDSNQASSRERYWFEKLNSTLNSRFPKRCKSEYIDTHEEEKRKYDSERRKLIYNCCCGSNITKP